MSRVVVASALLCVFGLACEETVVVGGGAPGEVVDRRPTEETGDGGTAEAEGGPPKVEFQESDFTESERSRDPFRAYGAMFAEEARSRVRSQREVLLDQYAIDELKLIGIVTRINPNKAMLVDPTGKGHVVTRGQFVGRAERVAGGQAGAEYEVNWRVDRIRDGDIVLIREDPALPDVPSATKVIPLRAEGTIIQAPPG